MNNLIESTATVRKICRSVQNTASKNLQNFSWKDCSSASIVSSLTLYLTLTQVEHGKSGTPWEGPQTQQAAHSLGEELEAM